MALASPTHGLVLFSDAHLGLSDLRRKTADIPERVAEMAKLANHFGYEILGNGDITEHNSPALAPERLTEEAGLFDEVLTSHYTKPYFAIHGNHDNENFFDSASLPQLFPRLADRGQCRFLPRLFIRDDMLVTHGDIAGSGAPAFHKIESHLATLRAQRLTRQEAFYLLLERIGFDEEVLQVIARQDVRFDTLKKATRLLPEPVAEFFCHSLEYLFQREWGIHDLMQGIADLPSKPFGKSLLPAALTSLARCLHPLLNYADRLAAINQKLRLIVNGHSHVPRLEARKPSGARKPYVYMNLGSFIGSVARPPMLGTVDFGKRQVALWKWEIGCWRKSKKLTY